MNNFSLFNQKILLSDPYLITLIFFFFFPDQTFFSTARRMIPIQKRHRAPFAYCKNTVKEILNQETAIPEPPPLALNSSIPHRRQKIIRKSQPGINSRRCLRSASTVPASVAGT